MKGYMLTIPTDPFAPITDAKEYDAPIPLADMQEAVGGPIETVPGFVCMRYKDEEVFGTAFCNEEGKLDREPINDRATSIWEASLSREAGHLVSADDFLVGNVIFVWGDDEFMEAL